MLKNGYGKWYMSNGEQFEGIFKNNLACGKGVYYRKNGQSPVEGIWRNNVLI